MMSEELNGFISNNEDLDREIGNLQICGYCLNREIKEMPWSEMKKYLINETKEMVILEGISGLYRLKDKISMIIIMIENQGGVDGVLRLLEEMKISVNNLINYIEEIGKR